MKVRDRLRAESAAWPNHMTPVPQEDWPIGATQLRIQPVAVWRSRHFLAMAYEPSDGAQRISILRSDMRRGQWRDGITWDELQRIKSECGLGERTAVEVFPPDRDVVNVANLRHLWVLDGPLAFAWRTSGDTYEGG